MDKTSMTAIFLLIGIFSSVQFADAQVGVCYGRNGDNLPSQQQVINLYKSNGITRMRIYDPDQATLQALKGSNIELILDVPNDNLQSLTDSTTATNWVNTNIKAFSDVKFKYIAVGNEVDPSDSNSQNILPAMQNIQNAINSANLQNQIKVSTAIQTGLVTNSYPPSNGVFTDSASNFIKPIVNFLVQNGAPLLVNVYPYFSYAQNQQSISIEYALFTQQGNNDVGYQNLFDAILDSVYAALEKLGANNLNIVVSESGWPSAGGVAASVDNAGTYYKNLINHVKGGTVKRPNGPIETYLFAMFDEDLKTGDETEKHFGVFNPDQSPKYQLSFN
ncbi:hypothetical protein HN51_034717 [Arachis hypogaea]|uniref:glucan endo-1,3-beta-glucosidase n=1 Tax=Arachis ipaensis TaxID=130454 RepID=UPI0007AF8DCE|nr:glucan endo-1,3-beta-glucosidase [Arachis ipaensis]XP_025642736.1 glucan endo-1,3-beta-glucosidase [Arachis hypogaea]QHN99574.1 Glucan endo-1,3-beta-glucosidase, acidic isoform [Arachis hypogaea]